MMLKWILWTKSCSPTIVTTANGEVQTHEEATVYVKELDIFLTIVVPGLSNSSSGSDPSTSRTLSRHWSHCSTSSSSSSLSPTVSDTKTRERVDRIDSDISPVQVSTTVDERSGRPGIDQAKKTPKTNKKGATERTRRPVAF